MLKFSSKKDIKAHDSCNLVISTAHLNSKIKSSSLLSPRLLKVILNCVLKMTSLLNRVLKLSHMQVYWVTNKQRIKLSHKIGLINNKIGLIHNYK